MLDDIQGEAKEIAAVGNGWLTYTPPLHTCVTNGLEPFGWVSTQLRSFRTFDSSVIRTLLQAAGERHDNRSPGLA